MRPLVTGGAGFVGRHVVAQFAASGGRPLVFDLVDLGAPKVDRVVGDVRDADALVKATAGCDAILHLAARISVAESLQDPAGYHTTNVTGTVHVLEAARRADLPVVQASSAAVYGPPMRLPCVEGDPTAPSSPYGWTKLMAEQWGRAYAQAHGLQVASLRLFNVFGPGQRVQGGYAAVVPRMLAAAAGGAPVVVDGDGLQTRDFVHVRDVARAFRLAVGHSGVFNVGSGSSVSILDLAKAVERATGRPLALKQGPPRPSDIRHSVASIARAEAVLGFRPEVTLEEGLRDALHGLEPRV